MATHPTLAAVAGPLTGSQFSLDTEESCVGREPTNQICVPSKSVSRRHCSLRVEVGQVSIRDLNSRNQTFVNGVPVTERILQHGDLIRIGDSSFRLLLPGREERIETGVVEFEDTDPANLAAVWLRKEDALYLEFEGVGSHPVPERVVRDLSTLLKVATRISTIQEPDSMYPQLLGTIFEVIPAERGAVLLTESSLENYVPVFAWDKASGPDKPVQVSRTVVSQVIKKSAATLVNDVPHDEALKTAESLKNWRVRSVLCVPLLSAHKILGVIYLDSSALGTSFNEGHLQLAMGIAGIAALALERIRYLERLRSENERLQTDLQIEHNIVGESPAIRSVLARIAKVGPTNSTVVLHGESGTGKELAARAVHRSSERREGPFIAINCAAIPETLLESELFGHERGAFTGAALQKKGQIEIANGGTLFLDEVTELTPQLQAKLLRVLQEREVMRIGASRPLKVDIRVIAATNKDLANAVAERTFREDLFYRLNVVSIKLPSLRERREDIPLLASYFVSKFAPKCKRHLLGLSAAAQDCLSRYDWPGNVRELENAIERAVVLGSTELISAEDLPEDIIDMQPAAGAEVTTYHSAVSDLKRQLIVKAVEQAKGNYTEAAKLLGVHPNYLHRLIRNMNLKPELQGSGGKRGLAVNS